MSGPLIKLSFLFDIKTLIQNLHSTRCTTVLGAEGVFNSHTVPIVAARLCTWDELVLL